MKHTIKLEMEIVAQDEDDIEWHCCNYECQFCAIEEWGKRCILGFGIKGTKTNNSGDQQPGPDCPGPGRYTLRLKRKSE